MMKLVRISLAVLAFTGAGIGWLMDRDAAVWKRARIIGRCGWALMALAIAGLVVLPGCSAGKIARDAFKDGVVR